MAGPRSILLLSNPRSGRASAGVGAALQTFTEAGIAVEHRRPDSADALDAEIRRHGDDYDAVVLAGGDGTVNAAAAALSESRRPLACCRSAPRTILPTRLPFPSEPRRHG